MFTATTNQQLREKITAWRQQGQSIAFVPTMGNLHQGHLELVKIAKQKADKVVVSIFVNPLQFERSEDLSSYPRTEEQDAEKLSAKQVDLLFLPRPSTMYPNGLEQQSYVEVPQLSQKLEGALRPGHFKGVSTIVNKLFNLVQPDFACFGQKDFQQLALIKQMVEDLAIPVEIIAVPTVRETSGLAMSSRNGLLAPEDLSKAPYLAVIMNKLGQQLTEAPEKAASLIAIASSQLNEKGFNTQSIDIVDAKSLEALSPSSSQAVILMAAYLGKVRLIDNLVVDLKA